MNEICTLFAKVRFDTDLCLDIVPKVWYNRLVPKLLEVFIMAIKWSFEEDYIICKFAYEYTMACLRRDILSLTQRHSIRFMMTSNFILTELKKKSKHLKCLRFLVETFRDSRSDDMPAPKSAGYIFIVQLLNDYSLKIEL